MCKRGISCKKLTEMSVKNDASGGVEDKHSYMLTCLIEYRAAMAE